MHFGAGFAPEVLDDDFLYMPVGFMQFPQGQQGVEALTAGLAYAYQDTGGKRYLHRPCRGNTVQAHLRLFIRRTVMGTAFLT